MYVYITYVLINKQLSCGLFKMIQPQRYPKERERNKKKKKRGVCVGFFFFFFLQASDLLGDSDAYQQRVKIAIRILPGRRGGVTSRGLGGGGVQRGSRL